MGFRNRILNGDCRIDRRNAGESVTISTLNGQYTLDRWNVNTNQASKVSVQQSTTAPAGFTHAALVTSLSAFSSAAGDYFGFVQYVEGFNSADFQWGTANAQAVTLSFRVRASITGTYSVAFGNSAGARSYVATFTVDSANTYETKTLNIPSDTSGTWLTDSGRGLRMWFDLGSGSTFNQASANTWTASNTLRTSGSVSLVGTNGATFYITGVQLEAGSVASPFERRDYGRELMMCQRYYYRLKSEATGTRMGSLFCDSTTVATALVSFPTSMRTRPLSLEQSGTAADYMVIAGAANPACNSVPAFGISTIDCASVNLTVASGLTTGFGGQIRAANANAFLAWSAEL